MSQWKTFFSQWREFQYLRITLKPFWTILFLNEENFYASEWFYCHAESFENGYECFKNLPNKMKIPLNNFSVSPNNLFLLMNKIAMPLNNFKIAPNHLKTALNDLKSILNEFIFLMNETNISMNNRKKAKS